MTDQWKPGFRYPPGSLVQPRLTDAIAQDQLSNPTFEGGDAGWDTSDPTWSITTGSAFQGSYKARFADGSVVAVADSDDEDTVCLSSDSVTFTPGDVGVGEHMSSGTQIAYSSAIDRWLICKSNAGVSWLSDNGGSSWTEITRTGDPLPTVHRALAYVPELGVFLLGDANDKVYRSSDGVDWVASTTTVTGTTSQFAYSPTLSMLVAPVTTGGAIWTSTDGGDTWISRSAPFDCGCVVWNPDAGKFYGFEVDGANIMSSSDGVTWADTGVDLPAGMVGSKQAVVYSASKQMFVAIDDGSPYAAYSDDGDAAVWNTATTPVAHTWKAIIYDAKNELFVACEDGGAASSFMTSPDGDVWTERTTSGVGIGGWGDLAFGSPAVAVTSTSENDGRLAVIPGQEIRIAVYARTVGDYTATVGITWHGAADALLSTDFSEEPVSGDSTAYRRVSVTATAPEDALTASVVLGVSGAGDEVRFDNVTISYAGPVGISQFLFKAVQAETGYSDAFEPTWPETVGLTVDDNEVTWEAIAANRIVWRAYPILESGSVEPTFPTVVDGEVADNTISWRTVTRRIEDENCPNTKEVAIAASKIFAGDDDIVAFSATVNPLDWSTAEDAGYIPFGLNTYGSQPVTALGLYRSNLVVFNSKAFQMWQVDEDPANMALLDAVPISCPHYKSLQPVSNDLVFLTEAGIRSMGIAGASTNLQAGMFGKQIDPLVLAAIAGGEVPNALYYPGAGQYWLFFGEEAFVLTMNGGKKDMSWSRYVFPAAISDWTILGQDLILRSADKIWRVDPDVLIDDSGGENVVFAGEVWWPYLDFGALGQTKQMIGFDTVAEGEYSVVFGYNQKNAAHATTSYTISEGDTLPGDIIPMPIAAPSIQMRLTFTGNTAWEWSASSLYLQDWRRTS